MYRRSVRQLGLVMGAGRRGGPAAGERRGDGQREDRVPDGQQSRGLIDFLPTLIEQNYFKYK